MNCRTCQYPLWNLCDRRCPECGTDFRPSDYRFVPGTVQFCCPSCAQPYYGTSPEGHLEPPHFTCVKCAQPLWMDAMVVLPAEGVSEEQTSAERMPWLDSRRGFVGRWFATIGWSMTASTRLIRLTPLESSLGSAMAFSMLTTLLYSLALIGAFCGCGAFAVMSSPRGGAGAGIAVAAIVMWLAGIVLGALLSTLLWALLSHILLLFGGPVPGGLRRTVQCLLYASGANVLCAVPCIGVYLSLVAWVWAAVSAILMICESQRVSGERASFAVLTPPIVAGGAIAAMFLCWFIPAMSAAQARALAFAKQAQSAQARSTYYTALDVQLAQQMLDALRARPGGLPRHAARLVAEGAMTPGQFLFSPAANAENIPIGGTSLQQLYTKTSSAQEYELKKAESYLPANTVAHRVGDFVFTYHGIDTRYTDPDLWLFVAESRQPPPPSPPGGSPPVQTPAVASTWLVGTNGGRIVQIGTDLKTNTDAQNRLRTSLGLAPIPYANDVVDFWPQSAPGVR